MGSCGGGCHGDSCAKYMHASKKKTIATMRSASALEMAAQRIRHHFRGSLAAAKRAIQTKKKNPERVIPNDFTVKGYVKISAGGRGKKY